ncbi:MAG: helix-hairpin-helix domain-containing protein [Bacteroidota bacterium]
MKTKWYNYFYFSKTQRNGIIILLCLSALFFILPNILPNYLELPPTDFSEIERDIADFEATTEFAPNEQVNESRPVELFSFNPNTVTKEELIGLGLQPKVATTFINYREAGAKFFKKEDIKNVYGITEADYQRLVPYIAIPVSRKSAIASKTTAPPAEVSNPPQLFEFDPNTASRYELLDLGLSPKVVQTLLNFRASGGKFWKPKHLKKIYGLEEAQYTTLEPYIKIPEAKQILAKMDVIPEALPNTYEAPTLVKVDINQANEAEWQQLRGIGEITARRIVNFRQQLGGFTSVEQLKTIYNVPDSTIDKVASQLIYSPIPNKININTVSADILKNHPYIKAKQAHTIVNYRTNHGRFERIEDLQKVKILTPEFIDRIAPYLTFE